MKITQELLARAIRNIYHETHDRSARANTVLSQNNGDGYFRFACPRAKNFGADS